MVALGGLLLVIGVLSFVAIPKLWKRAQEVWTETQGTMLESYLKEGERKSSAGKNKTSYIRTYTVQLKYRYQVERQEYAGDEPALRQPEDDEDRPQAVAIQADYKPGDAIAVFYRPGEPVKSRLTAKEPPVEFAKDLIFVVLYLLGGVGLLVLGRKLLR
jgi:hypothetical protein